jgi:hypothetical protein
MKWEDMDGSSVSSGFTAALSPRTFQLLTFGGVWLTVWAQFLRLFVLDAPALDRLWRLRRVHRSWRDEIPEALARHPVARCAVAAWLSQAIPARLSVLAQVGELGRYAELFVCELSRTATLDGDPGVQEAAAQVLHCTPTCCKMHAA